MAVRGWTVVFNGDRLQADLVAAVLEADGLRVEVFGDNAAYGVGLTLSDARVLVPDGQAAAARRLIKEAEERHPEADSDEV
jgi:putative signal transducing protein